MTTVPAVLAALKTLWSSAAPSLQVIEGTPLDTENDLLVIGYDSDNPAVSGRREAGNYATSFDLETYEIENLLSVWTGDADVPAARDRMFGFLSALDAALDADLSLGVAGVQRARITRWTFTQPISGEGATANLSFTVEVYASRF